MITATTSALEESEQLFRLLIETRDYAIIMLSPFGNVLSWNVGAEYIFGYESKEVIGKNISLCYSTANLETSFVLSQLADAIRQNRLEVEGQLLKKDGSLFFANIIYTPLYDGRGAIKGFAAMIRDITVQKELAEENKTLHEKLEERVRQRTVELENANKELNAFSYSVSHDLRTPLRAINGFSKMLVEDYMERLDGEGARIINNIIENSQLMGQLIDDLLEFSRLSRLEVLDQQADMKAVAVRCVNDLLQIWPEQKYSIFIGELPPCSADKSMMKQVWMNLIDNALKYSAKKDHADIKIDCIEKEHEYIYSISDNGAGFDMEYANNLFGVFQRLHTVEEFAGTGLGLALVSRIVVKHGGRIWAESEVAEGSTFYFTIPKSALTKLA